MFECVFNDIFFGNKQVNNLNEWIITSSGLWYKKGVISFVKYANAVS